MEGPIMQGHNPTPYILCAVCVRWECVVGLCNGGGGGLSQKQT